MAVTFCHMYWEYRLDLTSADISKALKKNDEVTASLKNLFEQTNIHFSIILKSTFELEGETPIRTGITFYWIRHAFEVDRNSLETKKKYVFLPNHHLFCWEIGSCFWFYERKTDG